jgi:Na+-driven multidrug efflux pump
LRFWNPDPEVVAAAAPILRFIGFCMTPVIAAALVFTQALYGAGDTLFVMVAEGILHLVCLMPLSYLSGITLGFGLWGVWGSMMFYVSALAGIMFFKFRTGSWKSIKL